jgi:hypothetical protein
MLANAAPLRLRSVLEPPRETMSHRFSLSAWLLAFALLALSMMAAPARPETARPAAPAVAPPAMPRALPTEDGVETHNCFDRDNSHSCMRIFRTTRKNPHVIVVPPSADGEAAAAEARDRRWVARCRPVIRQDIYGMPRYSYAAQGCEFGRLD